MFAVTSQIVGLGRHGPVSLAEIDSLTTNDDRVTVCLSFGIQSKNNLFVVRLVHLAATCTFERVNVQRHACDIKEDIWSRMLRPQAQPACPLLSQSLMTYGVQGGLVREWIQRAVGWNCVKIHTPSPERKSVVKLTKPCRCSGIETY